MTVEIRVPPLPESVADATLVAWRKRPGETVSRDENLADLETDKVVLEVPAPRAGVLREIHVPDGTIVTSGQLLAVLEETGAASAGAPTPRAADGVGGMPPAEAAPAQPAATPAVATSAVATSAVATSAAATRAAPAPAASADAAARAGAPLSPAVRRLVEDNRLDPARIPASGRDGRLTKADVVGFLQSARPANADPALPAPATAAGGGNAAPVPAPAGRAAPTTAATPAALVTPAMTPAARPAGARGERRVPMSRLRQRIAERLIEAQNTQALLTSFNEVDLKAVQDLRARYRMLFEKEQGVKLGFMSFFVKACVEALRRFPVVNAAIEGNEIVYHDFYDIGVAVSTERGLMVPVVRDADRQSFGELEKQIGAFATRAREGRIGLEELSGGTFTITNGGVFGSLMSTPIVNAPQSAILGMHKIQERPMVIDGVVVVRPMMYLALTYDHRLIDGREAVQFLVVVKECLEDPGRMLLGV